MRLRIVTEKTIETDIDFHDGPEGEVGGPDEQLHVEFNPSRWTPYFESKLETVGTPFDSIMYAQVLEQVILNWDLIEEDEELLRDIRFSKELSEVGCKLGEPVVLKVVRLKHLPTPLLRRTALGIAGSLDPKLKR